MLFRHVMASGISTVVAVASACTLTYDEFTPTEVSRPLATDVPLSDSVELVDPSSGTDTRDDSMRCIASSEDGGCLNVAVDAEARCGAGKCGGDCPPCAAGGTCSADSDCESSLFCSPGSNVCMAPTCEDGILNGSERNADCGGAACPGCPDGAACREPIDCASQSCNAAGVCAAPTCDDGVRNGDEPGVDCGGICSAGCDSGVACGGPDDCASGVCEATGCPADSTPCCQAPTCSDGVANGTEPVVDCGDDVCGTCALGHACTEDAQCATGLCGRSQTCEVPITCDDQLRNGDEGDVDCGGSDPDCQRCTTGQRCRIDADCDEESCVEGRCASCDDGILNGDEERVDCGGSESACPACPRCIEENSTDLRAAGVVTAVAADGCAKITRFERLAPTLLESVAGPYPIILTWRQDCSGRGGSHSFNVPFEERQFDGLSTNCAVIIDLAGSSQPTQLRWY